MKTKVSFLGATHIASTKSTPAFGFVYRMFTDPLPALYPGMVS
jgi:hypothetical protein